MYSDKQEDVIPLQFCPPLGLYALILQLHFPTTNQQNQLYVVRRKVWIWKKISLGHFDTFRSSSSFSFNHISMSCKHKWSAVGECGQSEEVTGRSHGVNEMGDQTQSIPHKYLANAARPREFKWRAHSLYCESAAGSTNLLAAGPWPISSPHSTSSVCHSTLFTLAEVKPATPFSSILVPGGRDDVWNLQNDSVTVSSSEGGSSLGRCCHGAASSYDANNGYGREVLCLITGLVFTFSHGLRHSSDVLVPLRF